MGDINTAIVGRIAHRLPRTEDFLDGATACTQKCKPIFRGRWSAADPSTTREKLP